MEQNPYLSYPEGYDKLVRRIVPFYFWPLRKLLMRLLLTILTDG